MRKQGTILLLILVGVSLPLWVGGWGTNLDALQAMAICFGTETSPLPERPFLRGGAARCLGDEEVERSAYLLAVVEPDARLSVIRAAMPFDVELAERAAKTSPKSAEAYFWLGEAQKQAGEIGQAISAYQTGLALDPTNGGEWDNLGVLYQTTRDWEQAVGAFNWACIYRDAGRNGCIHAAQVYMQHELYEQAAARYQDSLRQIPEYPSSLRGLANALIAQGRQDEAIPYLEILAAQGDASAQALLERLKASP